jgi:hypothetical protein
MPAVFISYSRKDKKTALSLHDDLEFRGIDSWLDSKDIPAGQKWLDEIKAAIQGASFFLLLLSPAALDSEYVAMECEVALQMGKQIIPLLLEPCNAPEAISQYQYVDLRDYNAGLQTLLKAIPKDYQNDKFNDLKGMLYGNSPDARQLAILEITHRKLKDFTDELMAALQDKDPETRVLAATALDAVSDPTALSALITAIHDPSFDVRSAAGWALVHLGELVIPAVTTVLCESQNEGAREMAQLVLKHIGTVNARKALEAC